VRTNASDRRTQRTRQLLSEALLALLAERPYDAITVQAIIERANVGRSTFYAHYQDKEDLLVSEFERVLDMLLQPISRAGHDSALSTHELFRHVQSHYPLYKALLWGKGIESLFKKGQAYLSRNFEERLAALLPEDRQPAVPISMLSIFLAGALLALLKWWLDSKMPYSPERMDAVFQQLAQPSVEAALGTTI